MPKFRIFRLLWYVRDSGKDNDQRPVSCFLSSNDLSKPTCDTSPEMLSNNSMIRLLRFSFVLSVVQDDVASGYSGSTTSAFASAAASQSESDGGDGNRVDISSEQSQASSQASSLPLLPPGDPNKKLPSMKLGETMSLEEMGPIILNADGTTRRISNWDQMTPQEQQTTWRRIKKRNAERRMKLLQEQEAEQTLENSSEL